MIWLKDADTKQPSISTTLFVVGFVVALIKLALSGMTIGSLTLQPFSGMDFAGVCGALGAIYHLEKKRKDELESKDG